MRGRPYIIGPSITVANVAIVKIYHGQDVDGIAQWFDISLPSVYVALAYYYEKKEVIDADIRAVSSGRETDEGISHQDAKNAKLGRFRSLAFFASWRDLLYFASSDRITARLILMAR